MKHLYILLVVLLVSVSLAHAQVFFNSENNSGQLTPMSPGMAYYQDRTKAGIITEMAPGITYFNLTGQNGTPGQTGIAVDNTPRFTPSVDPMVDPLMPPVPKPATIYDREFYDR